MQDDAHRTPNSVPKSEETLGRKYYAIEAKRLFVNELSDGAIFAWVVL